MKRRRRDVWYPREGGKRVAAPKVSNRAAAVRGGVARVRVGRAHRLHRAGATRARVRRARARRPAPGNPAPVRRERVRDDEDGGEGGERNSSRRRRAPPKKSTRRPAGKVQTRVPDEDSESLARGSRSGPSVASPCESPASC